MHTNPEGPVPDLTLERYRLQELPAAAAERLEQRLREDDELRRRLARLDEADGRLRESGRLETLDARVRGALAPDVARGRRAPMLRWAALAVVAAPIVLLLVVPRMTSLTADDTERIKGLQPSLALYRRVGSGSETLADGGVVRTGDVIRVGYRAAGRAYGVILSIDGRGQVTFHLPRAGDHAALLDKEATVLLDQSFELDDAPSYEQFYFVTSDHAFPVAPVAAAARQAASRGRPPAVPLRLDAGLDHTAFSLLKESQP